MNKTQLVDAVALAANMPKATAAVAVDAMWDTLAKTLAAKEQVAIAGIGTFLPKLRKARTGRDPRTGGVLQIPEAFVVNFKAGKALKDAVNGALQGA